MSIAIEFPGTATGGQASGTSSITVNLAAPGANVLQYLDGIDLSAANGAAIAAGTLIIGNGVGGTVSFDYSSNMTTGIFTYSWRAPTISGWPANATNTGFSITLSNTNAALTLKLNVYGHNVPQ